MRASWVIVWEIMDWYVSRLAYQLATMIGASDVLLVGLMGGG